MDEPMRHDPPAQRGPSDAEHCAPASPETYRRWALGSWIVSVVSCALCGAVAPDPLVWGLGLLAMMAAVVGCDCANAARDGGR